MTDGLIISAGDLSCDLAAVHTSRLPRAQFSRLGLRLRRSSAWCYRAAAALM